MAAGLRPVVEEARAAILAVYHSGDFHTEAKLDNSPVTEADRASHRILTAGLAKLTPDIPVVSEEAVGTRPTIKEGHPFWLVDPLDGTKEFVRRLDNFTINVGLVDGEGVARFGFVDIPVEGRSFVGGQGRAWVWDETGQKLLAPLGAASPAEPLRVAMSRSHRGQAEEWLSDHHLPVKDLVYAGSAIKFAWIAEGRVDLYVRLLPTMGWDTAAGQAVLNAVGAEVVTLEGSPLRYRPGAFPNPHFVASRPGVL
nr:3'(2'),5'-bisphosphate nucleotidase CysQ [Sulfobacillus harzensis]